MSEAGRLHPPDGMPPLGPPAWPPPSPPPPPRRRRWWLPVTVIGVVAVAIGAVVAVAQLAGGGDDDRGAAAPRRSTTVPAERAPGTTLDMPERTAPPKPSDGEEFTDPEGTYTITLGPDWTDLPSTVLAEIENWAVAAPADSFTPNVNVLVQDASGIDQDEYMELSVESLKSVGGELIDQAVVTGPNGNTLGLIEYTARSPGVGVDLHFVGVFEVRDGTAVVGTFTAPLDRFDDLWPAVEPYLMTLHVTG